MSDLQQTLKAGGMVPANAKLGKDDAVDVVVARAYHHAVLPGRTVIRLTAEGVAAGDDLEMATIGFGPGEDRGAVAKERKRPLGFPGWALVHDPKNARYALDVVKEFKKQARKAKSKPGHAKEGIDAIAAKLGKTVPHFLPSFFEEAGRAFIEHGAQTYAAAMFGKAREAEAVHALEVDEQHRIDGFLEFALAGAVTTKALTQYAKELAEGHDAKTAYAHFRQLCLQRTLGGMPPWSGMGKELAKLAKAAKLDPKAEDAAFIAEIIESPALAKAAAEFWRVYEEPISELGKQSASARGALLNLFPTGTTYNADLDDVWLELLDSTGASAALVGSDAPAEAQPNGGRAAWFDKLTQHLARNWRSKASGGRAFDLLRRMAPMLVADGKPIHCGGRWAMDLDLAELALALGVTVQPVEHARLDLSSWATIATEPNRGCDPVRAAAHPAIGPILQEAVAGQIGSEPFDTASHGKAGFLAAKRAWLERVIAEGESGALPAIEAMLGVVSSKVKAETFAELPDLHARFAAIDLAPALGRTLRAGIIDEYGWPLLEEVCAELNPDGKTELHIHGGPPAVVVASKIRAIAVGAAGRLGTHDLVIPAKHEFATARFIGGEFLVVLKESYKVRCYWSSAPHDLWESPNTSTWSLPTMVGSAVVLADGAWIEAMEAMRRGERKLSLGGTIAASDGTTTWINEWQNNEYRWVEVTASGEKGRASWPAWIEAAADSEWRIDPNASYLFPLPPGITNSPLGSANGSIGARLRYQGKTIHHKDKRELETIDGVRFALGAHASPNALLELPDGAHRVPIEAQSEYSEGRWVTFYDPTGTYIASKVGKDVRYFRGQAAFVLYPFYSYFTARDVAGSRRIHAVTDDDARAMMAAVKVTTGTPPGVEHPEPFDVASAVMPEVTHERLRWGVTGIVVMAVQHRIERDRLATERAPGAAKPVDPSGPDDAVLIEALAGWMEKQWAYAGRGWTQITRTGQLFADDDRADRVVGEVPPSMFFWFDFALAPSVLAFVATAIGTPAARRTLLGELYAHLVTALPSPTKLRWVDVKRDDTVAAEHDHATSFTLRWHAGNAYALRRWGYDANHYSVLEYAPGGDFKPLPGFAIKRDTRAHGDVDPAEAMVAALAAGKTSWSEDAPARLATLTGLTPSEATYLWAGCPNATDRGANFLDKALRETLGLKATQAAIARDSISAIGLAKRIAAVDEAVRTAGVAGLFDGSAVDALATAWLKHVGKRMPVPEEVVEVAGEIYAPMQPSAALAMIANAREAPELTRDGCFALDKEGDIIRTRTPEPLVGQDKLTDDEAVFAVETLQTVDVYVPFLYAALPVGHTLRAQAAAAYELVLERVRNPHLLVDGGSKWMDEEGEKAYDRMLEGLGGEVLTGFEANHAGRRFPGAILVRDRRYAELKLRPSELDAKTQPLVTQLAKSIDEDSSVFVKAVEYLRSEDLAAVVARIAKTPVPDGGWEQNPLASASKLVDKVAKARGISRDAAALYLQYLVLLWPTAKNLQLWNGWTPKQLAAANAELVDQELVLEAKRERAGRGYFLPGGWEALKSPNPPFESWKLAFYGTRDPGGAPRARFYRYLALAPFHLLYERAWARIESGDIPRYEEVKR
ncbi:MAG: hypothetical protein ABI867_38775 [Kofleriaceae bacterium]